MKKMHLIALVATMSGCSVVGSQQENAGAQAQGVERANEASPRPGIGALHADVRLAAAADGDDDAGVPAPPPYFALLSDARPQIVFPTYTPQQRQLVAQQAQILLRDLYVHRFEKIAYYGPQVDPVPAIADIVERAATMSDADLHLAIEYIFSATRDLHTNYYLPAPYSCFEVFLPLYFSELRGEARTRLVVAETEPFWATFDPQVANIQSGDELVSYNGALTEDALQALVVEGAGANYDGGRRRAMQALSNRIQIMQPLPGENVVHLVLRRADRTTYAVDLPWISYNSCADTGAQGSGSAQARAPKTSQTPALQAPRAPRTFRTDIADNIYQRRFHDRAGLTAHTAASLTLLPSAEPILWYGTVAQGNDTYGYLYLDSFEPSVLDIPGTLAEMSRILTGPLASTVGLIIDVRDNGGGWINLGEEMLQLFSPHHVETIGFRLKNSALNAFFFDTIAPYDQGDPFLPLIDAARGTRGPYTGLAPITDDLSANSLSQAYFGPVAVLTNSGCFSTCDMFTAGMQDNALATIWGEDLRTGAGGANVWNYSFFGEWLPTDQQGPFLPLPGGQDMRVAWRDAIRAGLHRGQVLEDYGVTADRNAGLTMNDVLNQNATQLATITRDLHRNAPSTVARVSFDDGGIAVLNVSAGAPITIPASVAGTSQVAFFLDGTSIGVQSIAAPGSVTLSPPGFVAQGVGTHQLEIRGEASGQAAWRAFRGVNVTP
jgi:C-terminal processing protease CtpA/Prc